jgi:hypothetical protein
MKKLKTLKKSLVLLLIGVFSLTTSCSSDNSDNTEETPTVIGKWHNYKRVENGKTQTVISDLNYEFQTNACVITENGYVKSYIYKVDGDYIKYYNPKTEVLTGSEKIVSLTKDELVVVNQYNDDELKYFKRL